MAQQGQFNSVFVNVTSGQLIIPAGFKRLYVDVESGQAMIDLTTLNAGRNMSFGGYDGNWSSVSSHVIGITGGLAHVSYDI